jgi:multiple sugar transport system permease protein
MTPSSPGTSTVTDPRQPRTVTPRTAGELASPAERARHRRTALSAWAMMSPLLVVLIVMTIAPAIYLFYSSLRSGTLLGGDSQFIGLDNYKDVLTDPDQRHTFIVTFAFVIVAVSIQTLLGLGLAIPLAAQTRANKIAGTLMLLPFVVTPAVSALVFRELLNPNYGWLDYYMGKIGLPANVEWLSNDSTAWMAVIGLDVWQWTPFVALILVAGLQSLPAEPVEAAAIDGASAWQTFRFVTLPLLMPFLAIAVVLRTIQAFKTFDSFKILTGGGPGNATEIINLGIHRVALQSFRIGAAAAAAVFFLIILSVFVPVLLRVVGRHANPEEA